MMTASQMTMLLIQVFGGLAIFVYGMNIMSEGLQRAAGEKMKSILRVFSSNRLIAVFSGAAVTAVVQSSSASTVMVIGFINAGLLTLAQAIGIIFGANIGTTVTAQIIAFDISWIVMPAIIAGVVMGFFSKQRVTAWGLVLLGLGLVFLGMGIMGDELKALASQPAFVDAFKFFKCSPVNGVMPFGALLGAIGVGIVTTCLVQSSSACTGIIIALAGSGVLDLYTSIALVLGSNIGTTITAQLAAIAANRVAKQAALAHTLFNFLGVIIAVISFCFVKDNEPFFFYIIKKVSAGGDLPRQIANAHTVFNVATTFILLPFIPLLAKICEKVLPIRTKKIKYQRLEEHLLSTPSIALTQSSSELRRMLKKAWKMVNCAFNIYDHNDAENRKMVKELEEREERIDEKQRAMTEYLQKLMLRPLKPRQAAMIPLLLHCTNDAERIGDHTAIIREMIENFLASEGTLSEEAQKEFTLLRRKLADQAECAFALLKKYTEEEYRRSCDLKAEIMVLAEQYEIIHMNRVKEGKCVPESGLFYLELISEIRKLSRHFANITDRSPFISAEPEHKDL
ncbi:MAG: Na/Pi cotransporter family protein [Lentisphaeria bacterium]|nr:Na/Pi cotransporter family protein [Lentisphaeria bacterium]